MPTVPAAELSSPSAERYRRGRLLGQGGMGTVFEAVDTSSGTRVALKILHARRSSADNLVRFKREFRAAARLSHPHCLSVHELHHGPGGEWFYTMEFAFGGHLHGDRPRPWQEVVDIGRQLLAALDHIHGKRIIHRDLKPQNILIHSRPDEPTWVKLADFGISKTFDIDEEVGAVLGSLPYLAPEQLEGRADPRSDLYALGMVLYEALAGRHPFASALAAARSGTMRDLRAWRRRHGLTLAPLSEVVLGLPPPLTSLIMQLLEPDPEDRPATAANVCDELDAVLEGHPLPAKARPRRRPLPPLTRAPYLSQATLVGRSAEARQLQHFVASVAGGLKEDDPVVLFVTGPAGTGKSRLLSEILRAADDRDVRVESGAWRDNGGSWALGSLMSALTTASARHPTRSLRETATDVTMGFNALPDSLPASEDPQGRYHQLGQALLALASQRPLLVLLEDAHWADDTSLELIGFLIRRVASTRSLHPRIGFVITHRPEGPLGLEALHRLAAEHSAKIEVPLGEFALEGTRALVCSLLSCTPSAQLDALIERLQASSRGNPLLVGQTLQLLLTEGKLRRSGADWQFAGVVAGDTSLPRSLHEAVGDRAARLSLETKRMLAAAAVIGREVELELLQQVSQMDALLLLDCVDEALRAEFINEHPRGPSALQFIHDRVRDAIVSRLGNVERRELHRRAAAALDDRRLEAPEREADMAYHLRAAGDLAGAQAAYVRAGRHAWGSQAFARAADLFAQAMAVTAEREVAPEGELVEQHADACLQAGRYEAALTGYQQRLSTEGQSRSRAQLMRKCAEVQWRRGNTAAAGPQFEAVLRTIGFPVPNTQAGCVRGWLTGLASASLRVAAPDRGVAASPTVVDEQEHLAAAVCLRLSEVYYYSNMPRSLFYTVQGFLRARNSSDARLRCEALSQQAYHFCAIHQGWLSRRLLVPAREIAARLPDADQAWNRLLHGMCLGASGDAQGYAQSLREAETLLASSDEPMKLRQVWTLLGEALLTLGEVRTAEDYGEKVLTLSTELGDVRGRGWGLYVRGWAAARRGDLPAGRALLAEAAVAADRGSDPVFRCCAQGRAALAALLAGDVMEAVLLSHASTTDLASRGLRHPTAANDGIFLASAAILLRREGSVPDDVRALVRRRLLLGRETASSLRLTAPLYWAGSASWAAASGRPERSRRLFARAAALARRHHLDGELQDVLALEALTHASSTSAGRANP